MMGAYRRLRTCLLALLVLAVGSAGVACGAIIGLDELPPMSRGADGGADARDELPREASTDAAPSRAGTLDPSFGDHGIAVIPVPFEKPASASVVLDGEEIVLIVPDSAAGNVVAIRCSDEGSCDSAHPTTLLASPSGMRRLTAVTDPRNSGVLVYGVQTKPGNDEENIVHLWRVTRDGRSVELATETLPAPFTQLDTAFAAGARRSVAIDNAGPEDASTVNLRARLPDGAADPSFGRHGLVAFAPASGHFTPFDGLMEEDGRIVVTGTVIDNAASWVLRFSDDGGIDRSFGQEAGVARSTLLPEVQSLALHQGGYVLGGRDRRGWGALLRLEHDGREDVSYWDGGVYSLVQKDDAGVPPPTNLDALGIEPDGSVVILGSTFAVLEAPEIILTRVSRNGVDPTFGKVGEIVVDEGYVAAHSSMALQAGHKVIITWLSADGFIKVARYLLE
ncbi:hypothetical protein LZC95_21105 [Pendulispora brunnea]|uniref:Uncharacterized protein n=1 Tax=Pendulispora brunnea TaxID=2905690 RepID=A0ABZ2KSM5_9BACT